jgi:hypothetical protein
MTIQLKVYNNGDHACLVWLPDDTRLIPQCRGFAIRKLSGANEEWLHGFVGFSDADKLDPAAPWKFPLQRFMWWDYGVKPGDKVQYSVVPVLGDQNHLELAKDKASAMSEAVTITGQMSPNVSAYFNKGIVAAQWVSRALADVGKNAKIADMIADPKNSLRRALSGLLRPQILSLLEATRNEGGEIYAALYELNDPELIAALTAFGKKCHLILANGAFNSKKPDENAAVRKTIKSKVDLHDRLVSNGHFAHNKFVVFCGADGKPKSVLSGSTNWTMTGLCTQANNGIIVNDADLAAEFLNEWNLLKAAGNSYPASLAKTNGTTKSVAVDGGKITQWFAPTDKAEDLDFARTLISGAQGGALFLFFNPGKFVGEDQPEKWTLLQNILNRHHEGAKDYNPALYIRGVVNQEIAGLTTEVPTGPKAKTKAAPKPAKHAVLDPSQPANPVTLFSGGNTPPQRLRYDAMVPKNIKDTFHNWQTEILGSGVHVHSKVIVLDPFGKHPVVITGSHNLGYKASHANDDNMMVVENNPKLAAAYAANIIAIYQTYRWNAYVEDHRQDPHVWHGLVDNDDWQTGYLQGDELAEIKFWLGDKPQGGPPDDKDALPPGPAAPPETTHDPLADPSPSAEAPAPKKRTSARTGAKKKAAKKKAPKKKAAKKKAAKKKKI